MDARHLVFIPDLVCQRMHTWSTHEPDTHARAESDSFHRRLVSSFQGLVDLNSGDRTRIGKLADAQLPRDLSLRVSRRTVFLWRRNGLDDCSVEARGCNPWVQPIDVNAKLGRQVSASLSEPILHNGSASAAERPSSAAKESGSLLDKF
jgi:hypothetical protein